MAVLDKLSVPLDNTNLGVLQPKLKNRYRILFVGLGSGDTKAATREVISVTRPNVTQEEVVIDSYNSKIYVPGKHAWNEITIDFRDDIDSDVIKLVDQQFAKQIDMAAQSSPRAAGAFKFETHIENLDGGNPSPEVFDVWKLFGCYISALNYQDTSYQTGADFQMIQLQLRYDNAEHLVKDKDYLSDPIFESSASTISTPTG